MARPSILVRMTTRSMRWTPRRGRSGGRLPRGVMCGPLPPSARMARPSTLDPRTTRSTQSARVNVVRESTTQQARRVPPVRRENTRNPQVRAGTRELYAPLSHSHVLGGCLGECTGHDRDDTARNALTPMRACVCIHLRMHERHRGACMYAPPTSKKDFAVLVFIRLLVIACAVPVHTMAISIMTERD